VNRLATAASPYLRQHATNPVDWYPWGEEAMTRAQEEGKPIFLSIGYSACHWCHVMERESFALPATAKLMNKYFVNVKVDREERPDIDALYMDAALWLNGSGGWPLNMLLTPDGKPFWCATYLPPVARHGYQAFPEVIKLMAGVWKKQRAQVDETAENLAERMRSATLHPPVDEPVDADVVSNAVEGLMMHFDWKFGGWGQAPKFPPAPVLEFLLRHGVPPTMVEKTLDAMAEGGMYDLVAGGFHRYAVDERWLIPHFEKMLDDNAGLAACYLHAWLVLGKERYREVAVETVEYMLRELALGNGAFASSQDADTDGEEGLTYTWTRSDGIPDQMLRIYEKNRFVLRGELTPELRAELFALRQQRPQPDRDNKAVAAWNGLALATLAECGRYLDRADLLDAARELADFLLGPLSDDAGRLHRSWLEGEASGTGFIDDYANVAHGLIELHAATGEAHWLDAAHRLATTAIDFFYDIDHGGFFQAPSDAERLLSRRKAFEDHPGPSGNSMMAFVLLRLARIYGDDRLEHYGESVFKLTRTGVDRVPMLFGTNLVALDFQLSPRKEIAIVGPADAPVARAVLERFDPHTVIAFGPSETIPLLEGKGLVEGEPAVYVCERFACQEPVTDPAALDLEPQRL